VSVIVNKIEIEIECLRILGKQISKLKNHNIVCFIYLCPVFTTWQLTRIKNTFCKGECRPVLLVLLAFEKR
jgi:hypothetical protein